MDLVIVRSRWLRGEERGKLLRKEDKKMCCLGFYLAACGLTERELLNQHNPEDVADLVPDQARWLVRSWGGDAWGDSGDAEELIGANDDSSLPETIRETRIATLFAEHDVRVTFVDTPTEDRSSQDRGKP